MIEDLFGLDEGPFDEPEYEPDADSDENLVAACYQDRRLRLNVDTVRGWDNDEWQAAMDWIERRVDETPAVIVAAQAEYAAARKCRACGCTDYFACDGGCTWIGPDLCSACKGKEVAE